MATEDTQANNISEATEKRFALIVRLLFTALLAVAIWFIYSLSQSNEEAVDYTSAKLMIGADFRRAIEYQHALTLSCDRSVMNKPDFEKLEIGLDGLTAWGHPWSMRADDRKVVLVYPLEGASNPQEVGQHLMDELASTDLEMRGPFARLSLVLAGTDMIAEYRCGDAR